MYFASSLTNKFEIRREKGGGRVGRSVVIISKAKKIVIDLKN